MSHINVSVSALVNEKTTPPGSTPNAVQSDSVQTVALTETLQLYRPAKLLGRKIDYWPPYFM